jgi:MFS family permease
MLSITHRGWLLTVLLAMLFMYQADATIVNVATPSIRADLGASGAQLELVISGYLLASATLLIIGARLGHLRGYRRVFLAGLAVFGGASLAAGWRPIRARWSPPGWSRASAGHSLSRRS